MSTGLILLEANEVTAWFLPGSDGLDEVLPDVERLKLETQRLSREHLAASIANFCQPSTGKPGCHHNS
jgi:hypothetical protein